MTVSECCLIKLLPYILFETYIRPSILAVYGQPKEPAMCQLYRRTVVLYNEILLLLSDDPKSAFERMLKYIW